MVVDSEKLELDSSSSGKRASKDKLSFVLISPVFLERWDHDTPLVTGIGGSETSHIEMYKYLSAWGHTVHSYVPLPDNVEETEFIRRVESFDIKNHSNSIVVDYRDPAFFDKELDPSNTYWFVAQDCDYAWTNERLSKLYRYICLCPVHASFTVAKYPQVAEKITYSSNGIRSDYIRHIKAQLKNEKVKRDPDRIIYTSSPDRGLLLILENWFRIRERCPKATFHYYYGFDNIDKILAVNPNNPLGPLKKKIMELSHQEGVYFHGRVPQSELYRAMAQSSIWFYPTDWPETSCITCMEMQAFGVIPVTNDLWALKQNILNGFLFEGVPQTSGILKIRMIDKVISLLEKTYSNNLRKEMAEEALETFDWRVFAKQFVNLGHADINR